MARDSEENPGEPAQKAPCKDGAHFTNADSNNCLIHSESPCRWRNKKDARNQQPVASVPSLFNRSV